MHLRGIVTGVGEVRTVDTSYGQRELAEVTLQRANRSDSTSAGWPNAAGDHATVTLWGDWSETVADLESGMELLLADVEEREYRGEIGYDTTADSFVVVEPGHLVDVTDVRSWVQCPRIHYLSELTGTPLAEPVIVGTVVHEVFGDLLRGRGLDESVDERVAEVGLDLGLLGVDVDAIADTVRQHATAIEGWLAQGTLTDEDEWRSERTLISPRFGLKGRADAIRRGVPVELKTGKNVRREPRFPDKIQAACYALLLLDRDVEVDTGTLLYTKNATLDRMDADGDVSPAKDFSIGRGLLEYALRMRNRIAAFERSGRVPTGHEADATCAYCFEREPCQVVAGRLDQESKAGTVGAPLPAEERTYVERLTDAIADERSAVHRQYARLWKRTAAERADAGRALIDLRPTVTRRLDDGRWELRADRPGGGSTRIRAGDIALASDGDPIEGNAELVRIERVAPDVIVTADEPVDLRRLDTYPSEFSTDRMLTAVHDAILAGDQELKDVLFGRRPPAFDGGSGCYVANNEGQNAAVNLALRAEDCALIQGPPGTGKTHTIAAIVRELAARGDRVLLAAFTNRAVDNALDAVREAWNAPADGDSAFTGPDASVPNRSIEESAIRLGTERSVDPSVRDLYLSRTGDPEKLAARFEEAAVVAATTATCGSRTMRSGSFDVAVIDEAAQLTEPGTLAAVARADRFVLVGDHRQLPPVVRTDGPLSQSLFERLIEEHPEAGVMLERQYRMAQRIQAFPSREFYDGRLRPATGTVATQRLADLADVDLDALPPELRRRVAFLDCEGDDGDHTDRDEAERVAEAVTAYLDAGVNPADVGVIAPYRAQVGEIGQLVPEGVAVDTVDRFQGSSREVILVSFVESDAVDGPIFEDYRRVNVALTRAKKALVLVGTADALRTDDRYARMVEWASER